MSTEADPMHSEAREPDTEADKINTSALGTLTIVGLLAMLSISLAVTALVRHDLDIEEGEKAQGENRVVSDLKAAQRSKLNGPAGYLDRTKGTVSLPIDLAQGLVVGELARDPSLATPAASAAASSAAPAASSAAPASPVDSAAPAATLPAPTNSGATSAQKKPGEAPKPDTKQIAVRPETGREVVKATPQSSGAPNVLPRPTPTAISSGAQNPGPTNK